MPIKEITHNPLTDQVIQTLQDLVWSGQVTPGEYLPPQHELAAQLGVGLSTIREAVKALSMIGLLEAHAGRGTRVLPDALKILNSQAAMKANLGCVESEKILEARLVVEVALTRMAAERAEARDIAAIEAALAEMQNALQDNGAFAHADLRFHLAVARASKNDVLAQTYYLLHNLLEQAIQAADALPGGKERALANHTQMLDGIKTRNPIMAQQASERQMADITEYLKR